MKIRFAVSRLTLALSVAFFLVAGVAFAASSGWVIFASPNAGQTNLLASVTAVAASDAWAVGYAYAADSQELTITQHWDGTSWSAIQSPNPGTAEECGNAVYGGNELWSVDAFSLNDVWAVGNLCGPGTARTLTMHWDGTGWAVIPSPNKSSLDDSELSSVSAVSSNDVWAVGNYQVAFQYQWETLIEHWNGTAWNICAKPESKRLGNYLPQGSQRGFSDRCLGRGIFARRSQASHRAIGMGPPGTSYQLPIRAGVISTACTPSRPSPRTTSGPSAIKTPMIRGKMVRA